MMLMLIFSFAMGGSLILLGFRSYRESRILADTPIMPIRSIAMGLTHTRGKATGNDRLTGPLTGAPCFYYKATVEYYSSGKNSGWHTLSDERDHRLFYLDDGTAQVAVNPQMAEFDLSPTFLHDPRRASGGYRFVEPSLGVAGPSDQDLGAYLTHRSAHARPAPEAANSSRWSWFLTTIGGLSIDSAAQQYRFTEECLLADRDCIVLGTCVENPRPQGDHDRNLIKRGENEKTFLISSKTEQKIEKELRKRALILILVGSFIIISGAIFALYAAR